jgi:His/Glu/Gln/Arg/opine family amino acid ABC transporter permease subunit
MELLSFGDAGYGDELLVGASITVRLAVYSFALSLLAGLLFVFVALSRNFVVRGLWRVCTSALMGVPSILVIFFIYYNSPALIRALFGVGYEISPFVAGVSGLAAVYSVYVGEVFRGAVLNTPSGQFDAARSIGLKTWAIWWFVILPQALRLALPGLTNVWMVVLKDTALVSMVGLADIVRIADVAAAVTKKPFLFYLFVGFAYIIFSSLTMVAAQRLERWVNRGQ